MGEVIELEVSSKLDYSENIKLLKKALKSLNEADDHIMDIHDPGNVHLMTTRTIMPSLINKLDHYLNELQLRHSMSKRMKRRHRSNSSTSASSTKKDGLALASSKSSTPPPSSKQPSKHTKKDATPAEKSSGRKSR